MPMAWGGCKKSEEYRLFHVNSPSSIIKNNTVYIMLTLCYTKGMKILEQAIRKAIANGWEMPFNSNVYEINRYMPTRPASIAFGIREDWQDDGQHLEGHWSIQELIFDHGFAKALWGEGLVCGYCGSNTHDAYCERQEYVALWEYHLKEMVISDDPIQYLGEQS